MLAFPSHTTKITSMSVVKDGILASSSSNEIILWNTTDGSSFSYLSIPLCYIHSIEVITSNLIAASCDNKIFIWDVEKAYH